jgi:hypothetical protein
LERPDGKDAGGYVADAARGNAPDVVVIQEWWGLSGQIKGLCDRIASQPPERGRIGRPVWSLMFPTRSSLRSVAS